MRRCSRGGDGRQAAQTMAGYVYALAAPVERDRGRSGPPPRFQNDWHSKDLASKLVVVGGRERRGGPLPGPASSIEAGVHQSMCSRPRATSGTALLGVSAPFHAPQPLKRRDGAFSTCLSE